MPEQPELFPPRQPQPEVSTRPSPMLARIEAGIRFLVRLYLGILLLVLPWLDFWTQNNLFTYSVTLDALGTSGFVRGVVSGLGALNILFAIQGLKPAARQTKPATR